MNKATATAIKAATTAGALLRDNLGNIKSIDYKGAFNIVTDVDKASERLILDILSSQTPDYSILTEEAGALHSGYKKRWLIDPLDGTTNYTHSYPFFCVSIALEDAGKIVSGAVYNPIADELFWAEEGLGAYLHNEQIHVSQVSTMSASLLATGFPPDTARAADNNMSRFVAVTDLTHGVRRDGSAALDLCFVACGRLDGFWETKLAPWDTAAGELIVTEAGGRVTNLEGCSFDMSNGYILATNNLIHDEIVAVFARLTNKRLTICDA